MSFDKNGKEIYIKVKINEGKDDSIFYISANEINTMENFKDNYFIYRVFNIKTKEPEVFIQNYNDFKNKINLVVESYSATLKGD